MSSTFNLASVTVYLVLQIFFFVEPDILVESLNRPTCWARGWPPRMYLLASLPPAYGNVTFKGLYCSPDKPNRWCTKPSLGYREACSLHQDSRVDVAHSRCNMTDIVLNMYPQLGDPHDVRPSGGYQLCLVVAAMNNSTTIYSKRKCCSVVKTTKCSVIHNVTVKATGKRQITVGWETPLDIDSNMAAFLKYIFYIVPANRNVENKTFTTSPPQRFSYTVKDLQPSTEYSITGACYMDSLKDVGDFNAPQYIRTAEEAPSPPTITSVQTHLVNGKGREVTIKWKLPPEEKRNGVIIKSIVKYWISNETSRASQQTVNGTSNSTVLYGLDAKTDYSVVVVSCNVECSEPSDQYQLKRLPNAEPSRSPVNTSTASLWIIIGVVCAVGILVFIVAIVLKRRRPTGYETRRESLPEVITHSLPDSHTSESESDGIYAIPAQADPSNHDGASMLQSNDDDDDDENKLSSKDDIPLCNSSARNSHCIDPPIPL